MHACRISWLVGAIFLSTVPVAAAPIKVLNFSGKGEITYSKNYDPVPPVGSPVRVYGSVDFGDAPLRQGFTGTVSLNDLEGDRSFQFVIAGAGISGRASQHSPPPYFGGRVTLSGGRLTSVSMYEEYETSINELSATSWSGISGDLFSSDAIIKELGGTWTLATVPEPGSWATMIIGFGLVGIVMRRRQRPPLASLRSR